MPSVTLPDPDGPGPLAAPVESYQWDWYGRLLSTTSPSGIVTQNAYDTSGHLAATTILDPDGTGPLTDLVTSWTYDAMGRVLTETNPMGHVTAQAYDSMGRLTSVTAADPDGSGPLAAPVTSFGYDALGRLTSQTDALGGITQFGYDSAGNQNTVTDALGNTTTSTFDAAGNVLTVTNALGQTTSFAYNNSGLLSQTTLPDPDGTGPLTAPTSSVIYDALGRAISSDGFDGRTQSWEYDSYGQLTSSTASDGSLQSFTYDAAGRTITATGTDPDGTGPQTAPVMTYVYDALGRVTQTTAPDGSTESLNYNDDLTVATVTNAAAQVTTFAYDEFGRRISTTDSLNNTSTVTYDDLSRVTSVTNAGGQTTSYTYDNLSRMVSQTDALSGVTSVTYDALGRRLSLTDPVNNTTSWTYDAVGRMVTETNTNNDTRTYVYDAIGQLSSRTDRNGREITFSYDDLGRQIQQQWLDGTTPVNTITTTYDADLHVSSITDNDSAYAFTWDNAHRLLTVDNTGTVGLPDIVLTNTYNDLGLQTGLSASIDGIIDFVNSYSYDSAGRMTQVTQTDGNASAGDVVTDKRIDMTFDSAGRFSTITRYEDLTGTNEIATSTYGYDGKGRITSLSHTTDDPTATRTLNAYTWTWDSRDRITSSTNSFDGTTTYTYDNTDQLTGESRTDLNNSTTSTSWAYDANGNRMSETVDASVFTYSTGANNQTLSDGVHTYEYDAEGNRTKKKTIATGDYVEYTWDHANLLALVSFKDSLGNLTKSVSYQYDALGRRIGKSVEEDGNGSIDRSQGFVYDGAGLLADSAGQIHIGGPNGELNHHGWVDDLVLVFEDEDGTGIQATELAARLLHGPAIDQVFSHETDSGEVLWALADHQGTVRDWAESADFDADGNEESEVINHLNHGAIGALESVSDNQNKSTDVDARISFFQSFTGQLYDPDVDLLYFKARWLDGRIGEFVSSDPMAFEAGDSNIKRLLGNQTTKRNDPTGLFLGDDQLTFKLKPSTIDLLFPPIAPPDFLDPTIDPITTMPSPGAVSKRIFESILDDHEEELDDYKDSGIDWVKENPGLVIVGGAILIGVAHAGVLRNFLCLHSIYGKKSLGRWTSALGLQEAPGCQGMISSTLMTMLSTWKLK